MLRSALPRRATHSLFLVATALVGSAGCAKSSRNAAPAPAPTGDASAGGGPAGLYDADEQRAHDQANTLRSRFLDGTELTDFGEPGCDAGTLRTYRDTTTAGRARMDKDVERLERLIIARGIETPIDSPDGHALLRTVIAWEAGTARPLWDVKSGAADKRAISPGLAGKFRNPATGKCETYADADIVTIVVPPLTNFERGTLDSAKVRVYVGEPGVNQAREAFFAAVGSRDTTSVFTYTRVRAAVVWRDYAVVAVNRPAERRGIQALPTGGGGASYVFHRVGGEWRLLAITRTWV